MGGRRLRPEEHWRPASARDLSKYKPRHAMAHRGNPDQTWEEHMAFINKKGQEMRQRLAKAQSGEASPVNAVECGIEGPPAKKIVGGIEAAEHQWPWQVALFIDDPGSVEVPSST